jgi:phospholipid/cholesterol/gamma-HCH transport system substrate-binding protein
MSSTFRLGAFIVSTLLILAAGVFLIGDKESLFKSTYRVKADFQNVAGLDPGADVRVGGLHEGTVRRIELPRRPDEKVTVVMDLATATRDIVKKDSIASIRSEGLVGDKYVEVSFGSQEAKRLQDGETIESEPPADLAELIKKTDQILDSTNQAVQSFDVTSGKLKSITSKIDEGTGTLGALVNDKTVYQQVNAGATSFRDNMEALKHNFLLRGFFNRRGYEDAEELTKHEISRLPAEPYSKAFTYDAKQLFDKPDSAKLKNKKVLQEAGKFLENEKFGLAVVAASTGAKGDTEKQRTLTEARTMVVRNYLAENFRVDDTRIKTIGLGKDPALGDDGGKVEMLVYPVPVARANQLPEPSRPSKVPR